MEEDTSTNFGTVFLEDSDVVPRDKLMLQIAECLNKLHAQGSSSLEVKQATNQLSAYFRRHDSLEVFLQIIVQSNSEAMAAANYLRGEYRSRLMVARTLDLEVLKNQEKLIISAILDYNISVVVEETLSMMIGDIYRTTACKKTFFK